MDVFPAPFRDEPEQALDYIEGYRDMFS